MTERNRSGFSVIEILVVCAALAILAAILMPVLNTARKTSYRVQCANNIRQFATAFSLYSHDWDGYWPCPGGLRGDWSYWAQTGSGGLQSYLPQRGVNSVWCCPMVTGWNGQYSPRSYSMNSYLRTPIDIEYDNGSTRILCGVDVCKLSRPGKTVLLYEGINLADDTDVNLDYVYRCANWGCVSGYGQYIKHPKPSDRPLHGRLNNYLYCDGHVVARRPGLCTIGKLSTYSEMYQWYVDKAAYEMKYERNWSKLVPRSRSL